MNKKKIKLESLPSRVLKEGRKRSYGNDDESAKKKKKTVGSR
jgi:hypothetical protein